MRVSRSPRSATARPAAASGSTSATTEAVVARTTRSPAKNIAYAIAVGTAPRNANDDRTSAEYRSGSSPSSAASGSRHTPPTTNPPSAESYGSSLAARVSRVTPAYPAADSRATRMPSAGLEPDLWSSATSSASPATDAATVAVPARPSRSPNARAPSAMSTGPEPSVTTVPMARPARSMAA